MHLADKIKQEATVKAVLTCARCKQPVESGKHHECGKSRNSEQAKGVTDERSN